MRTLRKGRKARTVALRQPPKPVPSRFITVQEAAEQLAISGHQLMNLIRGGQIAATNVALGLDTRASYRLERADIEAFIARRRIPVAVAAR